ncbi:MAG: Uma2 family endonuclease [Isosphaeraceae bacterium]
MATATVLQIRPADHGRKMTLEEFMEGEFEEGFRYELARGMLEVTYVPGQPHGLIVWTLLQMIVDYHTRHPGKIFQAGEAGEFRLWLPAMISSRNPDIAIVLHNTPRDPRGGRPPVLVMEVVSEGHEAHERDYVTKREEYLAFGIREYWIVDPIARILTVLVRDGDTWVEQVFRGDQQAKSTILPGLETALPALWAAALDQDDQNSELEEKA